MITWLIWITWIWYLLSPKGSQTLSLNHSLWLFHSLNSLHLYWSRQPWVFRCSTVLLFYLPYKYCYPINLIQSLKDPSQGPFSINGQEKFSANERKCYVCNIFSHWLRPCPAIAGKWAQVSLSFIYWSLSKFQWNLVILYQSWTRPYDLPQSLSCDLQHTFQVAHGKMKTESSYLLWPNGVLYNDMTITTWYMTCFIYGWPRSQSVIKGFTYITYFIGQYLAQAKIDGLVQERCNYIGNALELHLFCTNPSWYKMGSYVLPSLIGCDLVQP